MAIREATVLDLEVMVEEGEKFLKWIYPHRKVDKAHLYAVLHSLVKNGVVFIAESEGKFQGAIGAIILPSLWYPNEQILNELFWWVSNEYRCSTAGFRLMTRLIQYAKETPGIDKLVMSMEAESPLNEHAYTKRGFIFREQSFYMEV